jgi:hypothetical protein
MTKDLVLRLKYLGVDPRIGHRDYGFSIEDKDKNLRQVVLSIEDSIFQEHQLMFQEAPDLCYQKILRHLGDETAEPFLNQVKITSADIAYYRDFHPNSKGRIRPAARRAE